MKFNLGCSCWFILLQNSNRYGITIETLTKNTQLKWRFVWFCWGTHEIIIFIFTLFMEIFFYGNIKTVYEFYWDIVCAACLPHESSDFSYKLFWSYILINSRILVGETRTGNKNIHTWYYGVQRYYLFEVVNV